MPERKQSKRRREPRSAREALRRESDRLQRDQIRKLLAKPMRERVWFLRIRLPGGGSTL